MASTSHSINLNDQSNPTNQPVQNQEQTPAKENESEPPKVWKLDDPFEHTPEKPDGDPWEILLKPLMATNKAQCDIWKDEVQNLLIFAGLFSAVVTAFIVESYKGLQRDPNDDIVDLLSQIAAQLRNPPNTTALIAPAPSPLLSEFTPGSSTIRINIFWFISLILSLTTVLVGIVSLQWLREHQNYTNLTPMQQYAVFHMRNEGLEKWHVHKIFAAMPLLLQSALVLFFTGIIEFLQAFGHITVVIPVAIVIGLTFLFLIATTLLPTLQICTLFFRFSPGGKDSKPPVQCPYKSPQSNVFRSMSFPVFHLLRLLHPFLSAKYRQLQFLFRRSEGLSYSKERDQKLCDYTYSQHIRCSEWTWLAFDLNWLAIRDGFMRRAFHRPLDYQDRLGQDADQESVHLPVWDILRGLISQIAPISPVYHALSELSDKPLSIYSNHCGYFNDVVSMDIHRPDVHFSDFYEHFFERSDSKLLHKYQVLFTFLYRTPLQDQTAVTLHMMELQLRLIRYLYTSPCTVRDDKKRGFLPFCLRVDYGVSEARLLLQVAQATMALFEAMDRHSSSNGLINLPCGRGRLGEYMFYFGSALNSRSDDPAVLQALCSIFDLINKKLEQEISTLDSPAGDESRPSLLFYSAAVFVPLFQWAPFFEKDAAGRSESFNTLLATMHQYNLRTIDKGLSDPEIEHQLFSEYDYPPTFSPEWWTFLGDHSPLPGLGENITSLDGNTPPSIPADISSSSSQALVATPSANVTSSHDTPYVMSDTSDPGIPFTTGWISGTISLSYNNPSHGNYIEMPLNAAQSPVSLDCGSMDMGISPSLPDPDPPTHSPQSNFQGQVFVNPQLAVAEEDSFMSSYFPLDSTSEHDRSYDTAQTSSPEAASNAYPIPGATSLLSDNSPHGDDFSMTMLPNSTVEDDISPNAPSNPGGLSIPTTRLSSDDGDVTTIFEGRSNQT